MKSFCRILGVLVLVSSLAAAAAQSLNTSQIIGTVQDATGAAVPNATVTVTQIDNGFTRTVKSSGNGAYTAPDLPLGP
jgi:hypothetical protein